MVAVTDEFSGWASSIWMVAWKSRKRPFTVVSIMCFTANSTMEWAVSTVQVLVAAGVVVIRFLLLCAIL
jgi:hypothetical protein